MSFSPQKMYFDRILYKFKGFLDTFAPKDFWSLDTEKLYAEMIVIFNLTRF